MGHTGAVDVSLVCISRPDANDFVSQNAVPTGRGVRCVTRLPAVRHPLPGGDEESVQSRGSSVPLRAPFSVYLPQLLLFSASGPFHSGLSPPE